MSENTPQTDVSSDLPQDEKMLLDFKDSLDKKLSKDDKAENKDEAEDSSDIDEEELERQLNTPGLKQQQAIREKPSLLGNAKWYDKLFFSWTYKIIEYSQTNQLTLEDLGGLRNDDLVQVKLKEVEEVFYAQENKNILLAILIAFKDRFYWASAGIFIHIFINMCYPIIINKIITFMQDKEDQNFTYATNLIILLVCLNIGMMNSDCHNWYNNLSTGCMAQKIVTAMTVKKQLKLTAAASKNYEAGQIHAVRGATGRFVHFCWELNHYLTAPIWVLYCGIRLLIKVGPTSLIGVSLFIVCYYFDQYFHKTLAEEHHEEQKIREKRMNLTQESFDNIKTLKFYGWDEYFKKEILKFRQNEILKGQKISNIYLILEFVWNFLPNLMSSLCFICYFGFGIGEKFELADAMEILLLFEWIRGCLHYVLNMRAQYADLQICVRRIQDYLAQDEVSVKQIISSDDKSAESEYAVKINNQSFSWGLQTLDIDEMFDRMNKELKGLSEEKKTKEQLREEIEAKEKKEAELKKQRKLDNVVCLKEIDLKIKKGQFVCIIGKVGSGKSSLLNAMIGDLLPVPQQIIDSYKKSEGWEKELNQEEAEALQSDLIHYQQQGSKDKAIEVNGSVAYTQQTPWIRNKVVRENIIYNMEFDIERYVDTVQYCELESDLKSLNEGDQTMIGEKGVNLSGGQKARLGLARAVYANKDIYLMDDPISALDAHVRKQIIKNVYFGILKDRTRILVTNAIDFLNQADHIVMMEYGKIKAQGSYQELEKRKDFSDLMELNKINKDQVKDEIEDGLERSMVKELTKSANQDSFGDSTTTQSQQSQKKEQVNLEVHEFDFEERKDKEKLLVEKKDFESELDDGFNPDAIIQNSGPLVLGRKESIAYPLDQSLKQKKQKLIELGTVKKDDDKIIDDEEDEKAQIEKKTIRRLMDYYGHWSPFALLIAIEILLTYCYASVNYMYGQWAQDKGSQDDPVKFWAHVYKIIFIVFFQALSQIFKEYVKRRLINRTLQQVHNDVLMSILNAPVNLFFDVTPNGVIMNRFTDDMNVIDDIVNCFMMCMTISVEITYMFILICQQNMSALIVVPLLFGYAKYVWNFTLKAKRQALTILQKQRGPIATHQGEIMNGCSTIRAFDGEQNAIDVDAENQNYHFLAEQVSFATFTWYSTRLMFASCASTLITGTMCLYSKFQGADPIMIAMAFQQVVHLGYRINGLIHITGDFEKKLASVQKCFKLLDIPHENKSQTYFKDEAWPSKGAIKFNDVVVKYRPTTEEVLRGLSLEIKGGEKIGVVGRTGAGKSTITLALTRIIELTSGAIEVDGVNIGDISLQQVREAITIIPQEPLLFKGSVRFNLDPEDKSTDKEILEILEKAGLVELILKKKKEEDEKKKELEAKITPEQLARSLELKQIEDDSLLNYQIQAGGANLSSGEKSLICICRAILRKNKIVILDEATANIDIETEQVIQKLIQESFKDCTMMVVAHRLQTIIESDRILVLDSGHVAEFDTPSVLRKRPQSHFAKLIKEIQMDEKKTKLEKEINKQEEVKQAENED